jgi:endonuclease/exonuclease/phosphatase family metal-dependent hydrolase
MLREVRAHCSALSRAASDHLPLRAVLEWNGPETVTRGN